MPRPRAQRGGRFGGGGIDESGMKEKVAEKKVERASCGLIVGGSFSVAVRTPGL